MLINFSEISTGLLMVSEPLLPPLNSSACLLWWSFPLLIFTLFPFLSCHVLFPLLLLFPFGSSLLFTFSILSLFSPLLLPVILFLFSPFSPSFFIIFSFLFPTSFPLSWLLFLYTNHIDLPYVVLISPLLSSLPFLALFLSHGRGIQMRSVSGREQVGVEPVRRG